MIGKDVCKAGRFFFAVSEGLFVGARALQGDDQTEDEHDQA